MGWSRDLKYVALFIAIQLAALLLAVVGLPICAVLAALTLETTQPREIPPPYGSGIPQVVWGWPKPFWLWSNGVDGVWGPGKPHTRWQAFYWTALRNPVNNLRFVPGVSLIGRPLWRRTWGAKPGGWYAQAGWNSSGYPVLSAGRNFNIY